MEQMCKNPFIIREFISEVQNFTEIVYRFLHILVEFAIIVGYHLFHLFNKNFKNIYHKTINIISK